MGTRQRRSLFVYVEDVDATVARLREAGARVLREPADMPWGERVGFVAAADPEPVMPFVLGRSRAIVAIVFGDPLYWPPSEERSNKILWVSRRPLTAYSDLRILAQRMEGARGVGSPVRRVVVGGPGASIIDLPAAGRWRLTLEWSGMQDTLDLRYARRARGVAP